MTVLFICKKCCGIYGCSISDEFKYCSECETYYRKNNSTCLAVKWHSERREGFCKNCTEEEVDDG